MILKNLDSEYQSMIVRRGSVGQTHEVCILLVSKVKVSWNLFIKNS